MKGFGNCRRSLTQQDDPYFGKASFEADYSEDSTTSMRQENFLTDQQSTKSNSSFRFLISIPINSGV